MSRSRVLGSVRGLVVFLMVVLLSPGVSLAADDSPPLLEGVSEDPDISLPGGTVQITANATDDTQVHSVRVSINGTNNTMNPSVYVNSSVFLLPDGASGTNPWSCNDFSTCLDNATLGSFGDGTLDEKARSTSKNSRLHVTIEDSLLRTNTTINNVEYGTVLATDVNATGVGFFWHTSDCDGNNQNLSGDIETTTLFENYSQRFATMSQGSPWTVACVDSLNPGVKTSNTNNISAWEMDRFTINVSFETARTYTFDFNTSGLEPGTYTYVAYANDTSGKNASPRSGNFTVAGPLNVTLVFPLNSSVNKTSNDLRFVYNVTGGGNVQNCSLKINSSIQQTDSSVSKGMQEFNHSLANGDYTWGVECADDFGQEDSAGNFDLSVKAFHPQVTSIRPPENITLVAGGSKETRCNFTVRDGNGEADISSASAVMYFSKNKSSDPDDGNIHYSNSSCGLVSSGNLSRNYTCSFDLEYYAFNGTWFCNATATDYQGLVGTGENSTLVEPLFALNVSSGHIDYGNLSINQTSDEVKIDLENIGNVPINVSVWAYGDTIGDNLSLDCASGNLSAAYEKFSEQATEYVSKTSVSSVPKNLNFTLPARTSPSSNTKNSTFWQLRVPVKPTPLGRGKCNGTVLFESEPA